MAEICCHAFWGFSTEMSLNYLEKPPSIEVLNLTILLNFFKTNGCGFVVTIYHFISMSTIKYNEYQKIGTQNILTRFINNKLIS